MKEIQFKSFTENEFDKLIGWIDSLESLVQFAGPSFYFPLDRQQLVEYNARPSLRPYGIFLKEDDRHIGHCEINLSTQFPRLSRIIIGEKGLRGKGIGERVVKKLVGMIREEFESEIIDLKVFSFNKAAIHCYEKVGFRIVPELTDQLVFQELDWTRLTMQWREKWPD